jgi:hypothetical protein
MKVILSNRIQPITNQQEISPKKYHYQEKSDPVSSKNNVVFMTTIKWMPKKNITNAAIHKAYTYQDQPST